MVVSGRKYDPGKKMTKYKTNETPKTTPKKSKKNPEHQPQDKPKVDTEENQPTMSTQDDPVDVDSDEELPDPFQEQQQHDKGELDNDLLTQPGDDEPKGFSTKDSTKTRKKPGKQNN